MDEYILHCSITESIQFIQHDVDAFFGNRISLCKCVYVYVCVCVLTIA